MNYRDGAGFAEDKLSSREQASALKEVPSLYNYFEYMFNVVQIGAGPVIEYKRWRDYIDKSGSVTPGFTFAPAIRRFVIAFLYIGLMIVLSMYVSTSYVLTEEFGTKPLWFMVWYT